MRFLKLRENGEESFFLAEDRNLIPISEFIGSNSSIEEIIKKADIIKSKIKNKEFYSDGFKKKEYASIVSKNAKIICVGLNYKAHIQETRKEIPKYPVIFSKYGNSVAGHLENIKIIEDGLKVDYEGELGLLIGRRGFKIREEDALKYVFGYFVGNDLSSRELQYRTSQYLLGKSLDKFYPNGPYLVTSDEITDPQKLDIKTYFNGELRQDSNTSNMIFTIKKLVSYVSQYMTLEPGDVISTGTPEGVIMGMPEEKRRWISPGDNVRVVIEEIGELENNFL